MALERIEIRNKPADRDGAPYEAVFVWDNEEPISVASFDEKDKAMSWARMSTEKVVDCTGE